MAAQADSLPAALRAHQVRPQVRPQLARHVCHACRAAATMVAFLRSRLCSLFGLT